MGYTTKFKGRFDLDKELAPKHAEYLDQNELPEGPGGYFQWVPTKDRRGIEWDGGEKFYDYIAWLRWVAAKLKKWGYKMNGSVRWRGEEFDDTGVLTVVDNEVTWTGGGQNRGGE